MAQNEQKPSELAAILDKLTDLVASDRGGGITTEQIERLGEKLAEGQARAMRPSNAVHPGVSAFSHAEGEIKNPKEQLKRDCYFNGSKQDIEQLTPGEVAAWNALSDSLPEGDQRRTAQGGKWKASTTLDGRKLRVSVPAKSIDDRMDLPQGLTLILRELTAGQKAVDLNQMAQRLAELEAKVGATV